MNLRGWKLRVRALLRPRRVDQELNDELAFHIELETKKLIGEGVVAREARRRAQARFGSTTVIADECRDARGTAFIDNAFRDVQCALRSFRRAPLAAFTIVATVAVGLGAVAVVFTILNTFVFRVDTVPNINEMYGLDRAGQANVEQSLFTRPQFEAMRRETTAFTDAYAAVSDIDLYVDGRTMAVTLVTGNFFNVLGVTPLNGRVFTAADDAPGSEPVIVLSDKGWRRRFNRDPNVVGRTVRVGGAPFEIIGVMPAGFRGLEVSGPDFWAPVAQLGQFRPGDRGREDSVGLDIIGRLKPGVSMESARAQLTAWDSNRQTSNTDRRSETIVLLPRRGTIPQPLEAVALFMPVFLAFGLILMIGCANVANLLLARGVARQREIGIRLSLGASRRRIIRQLVTESWLLAMAAAGLGYVISRVALEGSVSWVMQKMPADIGDVNINVPAGDWRVALFLILAAMAATALFALVPALHATRVEPVRTLRGELVKNARPGRAREALIGVQVCAAALLLISAAIFLRSAFASSRFDPGLRTADTVIIEIANEPQRPAIVEALASEPTVTTYAAVRPGMLAAHEGIAVTDAGRTPIGYEFVSPEYFDVFGIPILRGRSFTPAERDDEHLVAIVSESLARELWPNGSGIGETLRLEQALRADTRTNEEPPMPAGRLTVVGVSRDVAGFRFTDSKDANIFLPTSVNAPKSWVAARVKGDPEVARRTLVDHLTRIDPHLGILVTMRTVAGLETFFLQIAFWVSLVLGGLAIVLTVSGVFSVVSFLVEQRTKEIGVRVALGASPHKVTRLILTQTTRPVTYGLLAGVGLAVSLATILIATPAGATISNIVRVTDPTAYAAGVLSIMAACVLAAWIPAARAARRDPMQTLRQE